MYDRAMLNVELDRCRGELKALEKQVELAAATKPVDMVEVERIARRARELSEHIEAVAGAIVQGRSSAPQ